MAVSIPKPIQYSIQVFPIHDCEHVHDVLGEAVDDTKVAGTESQEWRTESSEEFDAGLTARERIRFQGRQFVQHLKTDSRFKRVEVLLGPFNNRT
jgi:hypothetical protein